MTKNQRRSWTMMMCKSCHAHLSPPGKYQYIGSRTPTPLLFSSHLTTKVVIIFFPLTSFRLYFFDIVAHGRAPPTTPPISMTTMRKRNSTRMLKASSMNKHLPQRVETTSSTMDNRSRQHLPQRIETRKVNRDKAG